MNRRRCAAQRPQGEAQQAGPAGAAGVESANPVAAPRALGRAQDVGGRNPVAALHGGVANGEHPMRLAIAIQAAVEDQSPVVFIQHDASAADGVCVRRLDGHDVAVADGRVHAGFVGAERDARALVEQSGNDFAGIWRGR